MATMGVISLASSSITCAYSAPGSLVSPSIMAFASLRSMPRLSTRKSTTLRSGATIPVNPPISAAMLVMVARSSTLSSSIAWPEYSMTLARALPCLM